MSGPAETLKIAIWCLPGEYKKTQVSKLPDLINRFDAKDVSIQAKVQSAETVDEMKRSDSSRNHKEPYYMTFERSLRRRSQRPTQRLRHLVNHQFHLLEIYVFDDMEALHLPPATTPWFHSADLLIVVVDINAGYGSTLRPNTNSEPLSIGSDEPGLAYLRNRVKTTEHYLKYQEMLKNDQSFLRRNEESKKTRITIEDCRASVQRMLNILRSTDKTVTVLQVGQIRDLELSQTLQSFVEETKKKHDKTDENRIRVYKDIVGTDGRNTEQDSDESIKAKEIEGFVELVLSELAEIEKKRIRRKKLIRWFFGNDTVKLYKSYKREQGNKRKKNVTK